MAKNEQTDSGFLSEFLEKGSGSIHMVGICGVGMAGLAYHLKHRGFQVSGCDLQEGNLKSWLVSNGVEVFTGHDERHIEPSPELVIRSPAVPVSSPELRRAAAARAPVVRRGEVLPLLLRGEGSVAVAGTHGKTTTSSFIAQLLVETGRRVSWCIGGDTPSLKGVAGYSARSEVFVAEADESDGTLSRYRPEIGVLTNIEFDHMENFADPGEFKECFRGFVRQCKRIVYCRDSRELSSMCASCDNALSYGLSEGSGVRAVNLEREGLGTSFTLIAGGEEYGRFRLRLPGDHNVVNLLAALAVAMLKGVDVAEAAARVGCMRLPMRRFEVVVDRENLMVVSDYAHHPSEISALISSVVRVAAARRAEKIVAFFQPHRYTRTRALCNDFPGAFRGVDKLVLLPVYAASEKPVAGGTIWDLYSRFRDVQPDLDCSVAGSLQNLEKYIAAAAGESRILLVVGAGDVVRIAEWAQNCAESGLKPFAVSDSAKSCDPVAGFDEVLRKSLGEGAAVRRHESLRPRTTLGVGGGADIWVEPADEPDVSRLAAQCRARNVPLKVIGKGSNVLASDLGIRGVLLHLGGKAFSGWRPCSEGLVAGAGISLASLLEVGEKQELSGIEFLQGIPGTLGGALSMNAGAWGQEIGKRVVWVRYCDERGNIVLSGGEELGFEYRKCKGLTRSIALEACLRLEVSSRSSVSRVRSDFANRRAWMRRLRSAGSVFRNPPCSAAGELIEKAGLKGYSVGGASFFTGHANVIVTTSQATASDVAALIEKAREEVASRFRVELEPEIVRWD
jgi:UDP-N-acetylmuramate--L-alanine ligase/UDP-N-acetylenolpyruvoylglucosamine reductase